MSAEQITAIIIAIIGSGVLSAIVSALANKGKVKADSFQTILQSLADTSAKLMDVAEHRIANLCERAEKLEARISQLEGEIATLKTDVLERECMIDTLKRENANLKDEVDKMQKAVSCRDKRIKELERQVAELTSRLDAMNGSSGAVNGQQDGHGE